MDLETTFTDVVRAITMDVEKIMDQVKEITDQVKDKVKAKVKVKTSINPLLVATAIVELLDTAILLLLVSATIITTTKVPAALDSQVEITSATLGQVLNLDPLDSNPLQLAVNKAVDLATSKAADSNKSHSVPLAAINLNLAPVNKATMILVSVNSTATSVM